VSLRVVVVPSAPALLPRHASLVDPVAELRAACLDAVDWLVADRPGPVLVLAPERTAHEPTGTLRGRAIADHLLHGCGHRGGIQLLGPDGADPPPALDGRAVLALADGSARRGEKAPGHLDERAFGFDDATGAALRSGDLAVLRGLDVSLGSALLAEGVPVLRRLAAWVGGQAPGCAAPSGTVRSAELTYADDPYGVQYWVARWECAAPTAPVS
jgi:hypothetical protein